MWVGGAGVRVAPDGSAWVEEITLRLGQERTLKQVEKTGGWRVVGVFFLANVLFGAGLFFHAFLYNFYLQSLGHPEGVMGIAAASLSAGGLAALVPAGWAVDRLGVRASYVGAAVVATLGLAAGAMVEAALPIYVASAVAGAGAAAFRVTMGPAIMRLARPEIRARAFSWNTGLLVASGAGWTAAAGAASGWLMPLMEGDTVMGYRAALLVGAAVTLAAAGVVPLALRAAIAGAVGSASGAVQAMRRLALPRPLVLIIGVVGLFWIAGSLGLPFFNIYFQREHGLAVERIGVILSVGQVLTAVAVFASGEGAARVGPRRTLLLWMFLFPPAAWGLAAAGQLGPAVGFYMLQAFVLPAVNPLIDQILLEKAPEEQYGAVSSWRNVMVEGSGLVGATVGGYLLQSASFTGLFVLSGAVALLAAVATPFALRRSR